MIIDELHTYKGVFGSHIVQILRRFRRICRHYGSDPRFIVLSATISNPGEFAEMLAGIPFTVIDENGAPRAGRHMLFINPTDSPYTLSTQIFKEALDKGCKTIAFTQARKITELIYTWLVRERPQLERRVSSYRAGFLPEERRAIEEKLITGKMDGVVSTSALELGIDIGGLDVCILVGYPGTVITTWQRGGRVGRGNDESLVALVAQPDALDQYFMKHPKRFFESRFEKAIVDPSNKKIVKGHLACAAAELPLLSENDLFDVSGELAPVVTELSQERMLLQSASGHEWYAAQKRPHRNVDIRSTGETFTIIQEQTKKVVGKISGSRTYSECHAGAVYLHRGEHYLVTGLDLKRKNAYVKQVKTSYFTRTKSEKDTEILSRQRSRPAGNFIVRQGRLRVTQRIIGFEKRRISGQDLLSTHPLDLPPMVFETIGIWIEIEDFIREAVVRRGYRFMGGIHAAEHAMIALFPLFALCDRDDVGGISIPFHPQLNKAAVFVYDGYPEGVGLAERAFDVIEDLLEAALSVVETCTCDDGCPSCIHSPKCGSGNKPLDKRATILILQALLGKVSPQELGQAVPDEDGVFESMPADALPVEARTETGPRIVYFDLETQKLAQDVGGWSNQHLMRLSVGVVYDSITGEFRHFKEDRAEDLIDTLFNADMVVGFNVKRFDYKVLSAYTTKDLDKIPTFDILDDIHKRLGFRLSLDHLAGHTLDAAKTADGLKAVEWFREGKWEPLIEYCTKDVDITRRLFEFGCENAYLLYQAKKGPVVRLPVDWDVQEILKRIKEES